MHDLRFVALFCTVKNYFKSFGKKFFLKILPHAMAVYIYVLIQPEFSPYIFEIFKLN
jgi:hypothetical protein